MFILDMTSCGVNTAGEALITMDTMIPQITSTIVTLIKIGVPILLIIFGMMDLGKAVMAQKDDEIKKGQQTFIKRLVAAAVVFFVVFIVQIVIGLITTGNDKSNITNCIDCFINNNNCGK